MFLSLLLLFFDSQAKGRYVITREEADEYKRRMETARLQAAAHEARAAASQYDPSYTYGFRQAILGNEPT